MKRNVKLIVTLSSLALLLCACRGGRGRNSESSISLPWISGSTTVSPTTGSNPTTAGTTQGGSSGTTTGSQSVTSATSGTSVTSQTTATTSVTPPSSLPSTSLPDDVNTYYSGISDSLSGTDLLNALNSLNSSKRKKTVGYDGMKTFAAKCDIDPEGNGHIIGFYDNADVGTKWDTSKWNREHVWPNSRGGSLVEGDAHMTRPCSVSENSGRGSKGFGTASYDPGHSVTYYRGVASRIIFYCAIANTNLKIEDIVLNYDWGNPNDPGKTNTMGTLSDMLRWNLEYAPSGSYSNSADQVARRVELNRNEVIQNDSSGQGNINPFIDHPEYACRIWGSTNSTTRSICGM